jgi:hypothetical protein
MSPVHTCGISYLFLQDKISKLGLLLLLLASG